MTENIKEVIRSVDWDFRESSNSKSIHSIHPYPAKFIKEIPGTLLDILPIPEGTAVLDPFCGSGTTLVEAQDRGFESYGVDLNPIACLISKVKTTPLNNAFLQYAERCCDVARDNFTQYEVDIPNINHWFKLDIQQGISALMEEINKVDDKDINDALKLALSSILVKISNQESDTRYAAIDKNVVRESVFEQFLSACRRFEQYLSPNLFNADVKSTIINKSILEVTKSDFDKPIGMVITSPPYPNAYEYWLYHKYRMWWLGFNPNEVKSEEIGARAHYFKKNHQTIEDFKIQMDGVLKLLTDVVVKAGYVCFVVGRSIIHGIEYDNGQIINDLAKKNNFKVIEVLDRNMANHRKSFNLAHAKIKKETILVFQKC